MYFSKLARLVNADLKISSSSTVVHHSSVQMQQRTGEAPS